MYDVIIFEILRFRPSTCKEKLAFLDIVFEKMRFRRFFWIRVEGGPEEKSPLSNRLKKNPDTYGRSTNN